MLCTDVLTKREALGKVFSARMVEKVSSRNPADKDLCQLKSRVYTFNLNSRNTYLGEGLMIPLWQDSSLLLQGAELIQH